MKFSPQSNTVKALMISIFFTVASVISLLFASKLLQYKWLMQLLFLCFATTAIQIFMKYVLTKYEYICSDGNLMIYKSLGRKKVLIADVPLKYSASMLLSAKSFENSKDEYAFSEIYVYTQNLTPVNVYCYVTNATSKGALIKIECDEEFAKYINSFIEAEKKGNEFYA